MIVIINHTLSTRSGQQRTNYGTNWHLSIKVYFKVEHFMKNWRTNKQTTKQQIQQQQQQTAINNNNRGIGSRSSNGKYNISNTERFGDRLIVYSVKGCKVQVCSAFSQRGIFIVSQGCDMEPRFLRSRPKDRPTNVRQARGIGAWPYPDSTVFWWKKCVNTSLSIPVFIYFIHVVPIPESNQQPFS